MPCKPAALPFSQLKEDRTSFKLHYTKLNGLCGVICFVFFENFAAAGSCQRFLYEKLVPRGKMPGYKQEKARHLREILFKLPVYE